MRLRMSNNLVVPVESPIAKRLPDLEIATTGSSTLSSTGIRNLSLPVRVSNNARNDLEPRLYVRINRSSGEKQSAEHSSSASVCKLCQLHFVSLSECLY